jgi:HEAT repeat protein
MKWPGQRAVTGSVVAAAIAALIAAVAVVKDPLLEVWWIHQLETGAARERAGAIAWLERRGTARAVPALLREIERASVEASKAIDRQGIVLVPPSGLATVVGSPAGDALRSISKRATGDCSRVFADALASEGLAIRQLAAQMLTVLGPDAAAAVATVVSILEDEEEVAKLWPTHLLGVIAAIGPAARPALPALLARLRQKPDHMEIARALGRIAAGADVPVFLELLQDGDTKLRRAALWSLVQMDDRAAAALPAVRACLDDPDEEVPFLARHALAAIGKE